MGLRALVIDDTILFRKVISEALAELPGVEVVGTASSGRSALARIAELDPDVVTLDIEMPDMTGLEVLAEMRRRSLRAGVLVVSAVTVHGGELTLKALELGAFDFITKPIGLSAEQSRKAIREATGTLLKAYAHRCEIRSILQNRAPAPLPPKAPPAAADLASVTRRMERLSSSARPDMILIGVSTGGPVALGELIPKLPANLNLPVLIVQHMPPMFTKCLASSLDAKSALRVREAVDGDRLQPNMVFIAPGGKQMKLTPEAGEKVLRITDDPPENNCRPAVDYLFRSVAHQFPGRALAVIMTGMGSDGTLGLRLLKRTGCATLAQDEASCVVFGMPGEAVKAGVVDAVVPLNDMAAAICRMAKGAT